MIEFWQNSSTSNVWKDWLGGLTQGLLFKGGLYNDAPLVKFLANETTDIGSMVRKVNVGITDVLKGAYRDFTENDLSGTTLADVFFASLSFAGIFPPAEVLGGSYFDGGVVWGVDIFSAVNRCLEQTSADNIIVDVILTSGKDLAVVDASNFKSIQMLWRYLEISHWYGNNDGLLRAKFAFPDVNFRTIIAPSEELPSAQIALDYDKSQINSMVDLGKQDAQYAVSRENSFDDHVHFYSLKKTQPDAMRHVKFDEFIQRKDAGEFQDADADLDNYNQLFLQ